MGNDVAVQVQNADHTPGIAALAFTLEDPIEWSPFSVWLSLLLHAHGENVLRFKALLDVTGWSGPVMLDGVHHLIHAPIRRASRARYAIFWQHPGEEITRGCSNAMADANALSRPFLTGNLFS